jgi:hypothetical protein
MQGAPAAGLAQLDARSRDQFLEAVNIPAKREAVRSFLDDLTFDYITTAPVTDYVTQIDERSRLFQGLYKACIDRGWFIKLNAAVFGFVMVAPIPEIQRLISETQNGASMSFLDDAPSAIKSCLYSPPPPFLPF